jgi:hypothetical protein
LSDQNVRMESNVDNTLGDNVNQLKTQFNEIRDEFILKLNKCSDCIQTAVRLCQQAVETNVVLETKLVNVWDGEKEWKDIKVKSATTSIKGMVTLSVRCEKYATSVYTLIGEKDTFFTALLSKPWQLKRDPDNKSIFIDRDGKLFNHILAYENEKSTQ